MDRSRIDLFMSHRDCFEECRWWKRNEDNDEIPDSELIMQIEPSGIFWAKELQSERNDKGQFGGSLMIDRNRVAIRSPDNLGDLESNDLVLYQDKLWIVESCQRQIHRAGNMQYAKDSDVSHYWFISLRR